MIGIGANLMPIAAAVAGALNFGWSSGAQLEYLFADRASVNPVEGTAQISCTRAGATATRVNSAGLIETVAANVPRLDHDPTSLRFENLLTYSEQFDNAAWVRGSETGGSLSPNSAVAPDGTTTADTYTRATSTASFAYNYQLLTGQNANASAWTFSLWVRVPTGSTTISLVISDYTVTTRSSSSQAVSTTWQRLSFTVAAGQLANTTYIAVGLLGSTAGQAIEIWGAQLNSGSTALEYSKTGATAKAKWYACKGLLIEEARTNLAPYSEEMNSWSVVNSLNVTANAVAAPDGATTMDRLVETSTTAIHSIGLLVSLSSGTVYTYSVYAKAGERSILQLYVGGSFHATAYANFDLNAGTVTNGGFTSATIIALKDGICRCTVTFTSAATGSDAIYIGPATSSAQGRAASYAGNAANGIYAWGAQIEVGAFATSYMPTNGAAVTRNVETLSVPLGAWFSTTVGTMMAEVITVATALRGTATLATDTNNRIAMFTSTAAGGMYVANGGVVQAFTSVANSVTGSSTKHAFTWAANDFAVCGNGGTVATDSSGSLPSVPTLYLGQTNTFDGSEKLNGHLKRFAYWNTRQDNTYLQALTA